MAYYMGIDLGSTTSKAIIIDSDEVIIGEGLTNTRSNYTVAVLVAEEEAKLAAKFNFLIAGVKDNPRFKDRIDTVSGSLLRNVESKKFKARFEIFKAQCLDVSNHLTDKMERDRSRSALSDIFIMIEGEYDIIFNDLVRDRTLFFRDIISNLFLKFADNVYKKYFLTFDDLINIYDKAIIFVDNDINLLSFLDCIAFSLEDMKAINIIDEEDGKCIFKLAKNVDKILTIEDKGGTGYGRQLLPFQKDKIYSEILCHGLGSHYYFPGSRTVLDIGGQDTKAIQIDKKGMVTSFSMNDRCAAGCGRYLGYIADQLSINVSELSPLALKSNKLIKISSTCTVFAGAELRNKLNLGEKVENLVYSLEVAMAKRAMSLIARSGGVYNEFTFSGGVAKNQSMAEIVRNLVLKNYGESININVSPGSIFSGALGAALLAKRKG